MVRVLTRGAALAAVLLLLSVGDARAGTVGRDAAPGSERTPLTFRAAPGEANRVAASVIGASGYRVEDRGAPLAAGPGCSPTGDAHVVLCRQAMAGESPGVEARLGDRDDTVTFLGVDGTAFGATGNDSLTGGEGDDRLEGGSGDDALSGGGGADIVQGDSGDDALRGGPGHDGLAGGPGADRLIGDAGNDALHPNGFIFFPTAGPDELVPDRSHEETARARGSDLLSGGRGLDVAVYRFEDRRTAPRLSVTFDGRADDGPRGERDNAVGDLERVYSFAGGKRCRRAGSPPRTICSFGTFGISPRPGPNGERLRPSGAFALRIYRLSRRGTARVGSAVFDTSAEGGVRVSEGRSRRSPTEILLPREGFRSCGTTTAGAARRRSRRTVNRARGRARGPRYRIRGRYSAATVRGTDWTVADRCDGTLTSVRSGVVVVRDLRRRRTIVLRAGMRYLARAP